MSVPVYLLRGGDDILRGEALTRLLDDLVAGGDRSLLIDEFDLDTTRRWVRPAARKSSTTSTD